MAERPWNRAYLSLGSNIEPEQNVPAAVRELAAFGRAMAVSRVWESAPFGSGDSSNSRGVWNLSNGNFLNAAVLLETELSARDLCLDAVTAVERLLGRVRDPHEKSAPRTIDIDLSLFNRDVLTVGHRTIPDPDILTRAFVAVPLAELDPSYIHPTVQRTLADIAAKLGSTASLHLRADVSLR